jgi:hypothetical protein
LEERGHESEDRIDEEAEQDQDTIEFESAYPNLITQWKSQLLVWAAGQTFTVEAG